MKHYLILFFLPALMVIPVKKGIAQSDKLDSNYAHIYIYRPKNYLGSGSKITVYFNNVEIKKLANGTKFKSLLFSEGVLEIKLKSKSPYKINTFRVKIEKGKEHYLKIYWPTASNVILEQQKNELGKAVYEDAKVYKPGFYPETFKEDIHHPIPIYMEEIPDDSKPKESKDPLTNGSGFGISQDGYIMTNFHVIKDSEFLYVKGVNGDFSQRYKSKVIVKDELNDLAILKIDDEKFKGWEDSIPYQMKTKLSDVGESIFVLGYPLTTSMGDEIKLTNGIVSSKTGFKGIISLYQISAPVQPGNSGGPLFDENGNLIGVVTAKHTEAENVSYAIKSNYMTNLIDLLPHKINLSNNTALMGKSLPEQVKMIKEFVVLIEVH